MNNVLTIVPMIALLMMTLLVNVIVGCDKEDDRLTTEVLQIEKAIKEKNEYPDQETIDRLYRYRNCIDEKYGTSAPSKKFIEAYDRVIKPL